MCASETWELNEKEIRMLSIWEIKILWKIYGAKKEGKECKIRNNQELRNMYGQQDIIAEIKSKICEISSSHGGEYDVQNCLLGCTAV
jgi:hypothetical protein